MDSVILDAAEVRIIRQAATELEEAQRRFNDAAGLIIRARRLEGSFRLSEDLAELVPMATERQLPIKENDNGVTLP